RWRPRAVGRVLWSARKAVAVTAMECKDMHGMNRFLVSLLACALLPGAQLLAHERVDAERSRSAPTDRVSWRAPDKSRVATTHLRYAELPLQRVVAVHEANRTRDVRRQKAVQIGVARSAAGESHGGALPPLHWQ